MAEKFDPTPQALLLAYRVVETLDEYTMEKAAILRKIENKLHLHGYLRSGDFFYSKEEIQKLDPLTVGRDLQ